MSRRPLCMAALLLLIFLWFLPRQLWIKSPALPDRERILLTGTVARRENKAEKQAYYLKNCTADRTTSIENVLVYQSQGSTYPVGSQITLYGKLYQLAKAGNPGQFDAEQYYQSQGIVYTFLADGEALSVTGESLLGEFLTTQKECFAKALTQIYEERDAGILRAVLLGDKSEIPKEEKQLYQKNGISHLLAISGLHVSMLGMALYQLLRKAGASFGGAGIPSGVFLLLYGEMTGFGVSSVRAICMFLVMLLAEILGRTYDMSSGMALAAILVLVRNPLQLYQAAFLFSFGAVFGIAVVYPVLQKLFSVKSKLLQPLLFSLSISLVTFPITVHFYYEYPVYSMLLNLIVIPLMSLVMGFGVVSLLVGRLVLPLGKILGIPCHLILCFYEKAGEITLKLPFSRLVLGCEKRWQLFIYYGLLLLFLMAAWYGKRKKAVLLLPLAVLVVSVRIRSGLYFTMLDVGQGDGLFLRLPSGTTCLIDGGSSSVKEVWSYRILPYLKYEGVETLDYVIFSHLDGDHTSGVMELLEMEEPEIGIGQVLLPDLSEHDEAYEKMLSLAKKAGVSIGTIGKGDEILEDQALVRCLYPVKNSTGADRNELCTVLQVEYGGFSMLLTGDLGTAGERELLAMDVLTKNDVWKVSHHGSNYSGSMEFLRRTAPVVSLISAGKNNTYGHPGTELLKRLEALGSQVYVTIDSGAILLHSDGKNYSVRTGNASVQ